MKFFYAWIICSLSTSSFSGTDAAMVLRGPVQPVLAISIAPEPVATDLNLNENVTNLLVATITEKSNNSDGYKIKARSMNAGRLVNLEDNTSFVIYNLSYNGTNIPLAPADVPITTSNQKGTFTKFVKISYNQPDHLSAGIHEDTVRFTIEAN